MPNMDHLSRHEIYIPKDAEVKRIALQSLPRSLLMGMGLPPSISDTSRNLPDSPEGIWICPAVLRPKGQKLAPDTGNSLLENMSSKLAKESPPEPIQMSFVSYNRAAHKVLQETIRGASVSAGTPSTSDLPPGSAPHTYQIAVVIYQGRIYLSIRKPNQNQHQGETRAAPMASEPGAPSTSGMSSSSQKKHMNPEAPPKPAGKKPLKKRLRLPLPPGSLKLKNLTKKAPAVSQELPHVNRPERIQTQGKETQGGNNTKSHTSPLVSKPPDRTHRLDEQSKSHTGAEQTPEEAAGCRSPGPSPAGGEAANTSQSIIMDTNPQTDSSDQSWTRRESQSSSLQQQQSCDFKELEQEEKIAQIKAKLRLQEAALKNLKK